MIIWLKHVFKELTDFCGRLKIMHTEQGVLLTVEIKDYNVMIDKRNIFINLLELT